MDIAAIIAKADDATLKTVLSDLLNHYMNPAFGALPKNEVELLVLHSLHQLGAISPAPDVYELVCALRITRAKARGLIYNYELRQSSSSDLDRKLKQLLKRPLIQKDGELFVLEVENPLLSDHLRAKVQKLGYLSDGSFSPSLIKLSLDALCALIESLLSEDEVEQTRQALIQAGAPDGSFSGVLKASLKKLAHKLAADSGEAVMDKAAAFLGPILEASAKQILEHSRKLFGNTL